MDISKIHIEGLLEMMEGALLCVDKDGIPVYWNRGTSEYALRYFGSEMKPNLPVYQFFSSELESYISHIITDEEGAGVFRFMDVVSLNEDEEFWIQFTLYPVPANKRVDYIWIQALDISEKKETIDRDARRERRFRRLVRHSSDIIAIVGTDDRILYISESLERILGYSINGMRDEKISYYVHPQDMDSYQAFMSSIRGSDNYYRAELQFRHAAGGYVYLELVGTDMTDDPSIEGLLINGRDVTNRKEMESVLERIYRQREMILEAAGDGIFGCNLNRVITFINPAGSRILSREESRIIGLRDLDVLIYQDEEGNRLSGEDDPVRYAMEAGERGRSWNLFFQVKEGVRFPVSCSVNPILEGDHVTGAVVTFRDITEERRTAEELMRTREMALEASRAKSEFLANMSHEIRTPLNSIIGFMELLYDTPLQERQKEYLDTSRDGAFHLLTIINDILDFSKIEQGRLELEEISFSLADEMENSLFLFTAMAAEKNIDYQFFIDPSLYVAVHGDSLRIKQVLINLISNAIKFTPEGGSVFVSMERTDQKRGSCQCRFHVFDTGIGMNEDEITRITGAFMQADSTITRKYGGTGLGLSIATVLLELMDSRLEVESVPGGGSLFSFSLSLGQEEEMPEGLKGGEKNVCLLLREGTLISGILRYMEILSIEGSIYLGDREILSADKEPDCIAVDYRLLEDGLIPGPLKRFQDKKRILLHDQSSVSVRGDWHEMMLLPLSMGKLLRLSGRNLLPGKHEIPDTSVEARYAGSVLMAEDNLTNQKLMKLMFAKFGLDVDMVSSGREALNAFDEKRYDLIFMDLHMPDGDGISTCIEIRKREGERGLDQVPVIALTAKALAGERERIYEAGMNEFLSKPVTLQRMEIVLNRFLMKTVSEGGINITLDKRAAMLGISPEDLKELTSECLEDLRKEMPRFIILIEKNDYSGIEELAHRLKGCCLTCGMDAIGEILQQMEDHAERKDESDLMKMYMRLDSAVAEKER